MGDMTQRRPQVLVTVGPGLLADLFRRSLVDIADVTVSGSSHDSSRLWDVAVVSGRDRVRGVRSRFVVMVASPVNRRCDCPATGLAVAEGAADYEMVVHTVRRLAVAAARQHAEETAGGAADEAAEVAQEASGPSDSEAVAVRR